MPPPLSICAFASASEIGRPASFGPIVPFLPSDAVAGRAFLREVGLAAVEVAEHDLCAGNGLRQPGARQMELRKGKDAARRRRERR